MGFFFSFFPVGERSGHSLLGHLLEKVLLSQIRRLLPLYICLQYFAVRINI